jgi:hypothetical protein
MKKCKSCKSEIDPKATKCPHCGTDQRNWFGRHKILTGIGIIILFFIIVGAAGSGKSTSNSATPSSDVTQSPTKVTEAPVVKPAPIVVDATTLISEYDKNKLSAQDKYNGKLVQTTGYIDNISNDITGSYYLSIHPTNDQYYFGTSIQCFFSDKSQLTSLAKQQSVTVTGTMQDMSLGIVEMKDCNVVN